MRYPKYLRFLDTFGALAILSAVAYAFAPDSIHPEQRLDGLWGNLTTELIGIWLSVRLIDWIIRAHESFTKARVRTVRVMRALERQMHLLIDFQRAHDLRNFYRELDWFSTRLLSRRKHFSTDESHDIDVFLTKIQDMLAFFPDRYALAADEQILSVEDTARPKLISLLSELELARKTAEKNILAETDEDDGM